MPRNQLPECGLRRRAHAALSIFNSAHPHVDLCSYDDNARRELSEEMGIPDSIPLCFVATFKHEDERQSAQAAFFRFCRLTRRLQMSNMGRHIHVHIRWAA